MRELYNSITSFVRRGPPKIFEDFTTWRINRRKRILLKKIDSLDVALSNNLKENTDGDEEKSKKKKADLDSIRLNYLLGYVKGWSELNHRYFLGAVLAGVAGMLGAFLKSLIDESQQYQEVEKRLTSIESKVISIAKKAEQIASRVDLSKEVTSKKNAEDDDDSSRVIARIREHLTELMVLRAEVKSIEEQLENIKLFWRIKDSSRTNKIKVRINKIASEIAGLNDLFSNIILIVIGDHERAIRVVEKRIIDRYEKSQSTDCRRFFCDSSFENILNSLALKDERLSVDLALLSFIYLKMQKDYKEGEEVYSVFEGKNITGTPYAIIQKLGKPFSSISEKTPYMKGIAHNTAFSKVLEAERLLSKNSQNELSEARVLLDSSRISLESNIDEWVTNPQPMPYYSFFKWNEVDCKFKNQSESKMDCQKTQAKYREMVEKLRGHNFEEVSHISCAKN